MKNEHNLVQVSTQDFYKIIRSQGLDVGVYCCGLPIGVCEFRFRNSGELFGKVITDFNRPLSECTYLVNKKYHESHEDRKA